MQLRAPDGIPIHDHSGVIRAGWKEWIQPQQLPPAIFFLMHLGDLIRHHEHSRDLMAIDTNPRVALTVYGTP